MKRALITGITGQDGSYLAELLLSKGYEVHGLVRRTSLRSTERLNGFEERIIFHEGNMTDGFSLVEAVKKSQPDEVYNLAAQSHVAHSFKVPYETREINFHGVVRLVHALEEVGIADIVRLYQASTSEMFGNSAEPPQNENSPLEPISPYAQAKLEAHNFIKRQREEKGRFYCSGILFNHESPRRGWNFVTKKITAQVSRMKEGIDNVLVLGNLSPKRDWGFAGDYVEAMWLMLQQEKPQDYVVASGETHTVSEFVDRVFKSAGNLQYELFDLSNESEVDADKRIEELRKSKGLFVVQHPKYFRPADINLLLGDSSKAREILNWRPKTSFDDLVKMMIDHDLANTK